MRERGKIVIIVGCMLCAWMKPKIEYENGRRKKINCFEIRRMCCFVVCSGNWYAACQWPPIGPFIAYVTTAAALARLTRKLHGWSGQGSRTCSAQFGLQSVQPAAIAYADNRRNQNMAWFSMQLQCIYWMGEKWESASIRRCWRNIGRFTRLWPAKKKFRKFVQRASL